MTSVVSVILLAITLGGVNEEGRCWTNRVVHDVTRDVETVTECRMEGSESTVSFGSVREVPWRLAPAAGRAADGSECWFWTSVRGEDLPVPDPLWPARELPACVGEPAGPAGPSALEEAYGLLASYAHPAPGPVVDPIAGRGLAGLDTHVTVPVPAPWSATLVSPLTGRTITVVTRVREVLVEWGDGETSTAVVSGGVAEADHVYEAKTCREAGPRCGLVAPDGYPLSVRFRWEASFDADGAGPSPLSVPDTAAAVPYPVAEIIGVLTE